MFVNVRLIKPWNGHQPGRVFQDFPATSAELLVRRDVAEVLPDGVASEAGGEPAKGDNRDKPAAKVAGKVRKR